MHCTVQKPLSKTKIINALLTNNIYNQKEKKIEIHASTKWQKIAYVPSMPGMLLVSRLPGGTAISYVTR